MSLFYRLKPRLAWLFSRGWAVIWRAMVKYSETDGEQRAASFAYYAFFSIFPLLLVLTTLLEKMWVSFSWPSYSG